MEALSSPSPSPSRSLLPELLGPTRSPPTVSLSLNRNRRPVFAAAAAAATSSSSSSAPIGAPILKSPSSLLSSSPRRPVLVEALPNGSSSQSGAGADADSHSHSLPINFQVSSSDLTSTENMDHGTHVSSSPSTGLSGSRAGLFRTPISGGVHSATSAHDLPPPALAVRNLMEQARFAHLSTTMSKMHHRRAGYPFGSLVDFASDSIGLIYFLFDLAACISTNNTYLRDPIFSLSPLAIHRNLLADPRCTLVVQIPGWSGLSNARVTIFGDVVPLPAEQQDWARQQYIAKHQQWASQQWGNFYYYRMQTIGFCIDREG